MSDFINTVDIIGEDELMDQIIQRTVTEIRDDVVTQIGDSVFRDCIALTIVDCPNVTNSGFKDIYVMPDQCFAGCTALVNVNLPLLEQVGGHYHPGMFSGCTALEKLEFWNAKGIARNAFAGCTALKTLILRMADAVCPLRGNTFGNTPIATGTGYIYVPRVLLSDTDATMDYRQATNWSAFSTQFRALEDYTVDGTTTGALDESKI